VKRPSRERWAAVVLALLFAACHGVAWAALGPISVVPALAAALGIVVALALELHRRTRKAVEEDSAQTRHWVALQTTLGADQPLPALGGYAVEPDCAAVLARHILAHRPQCVVEAGCGASTIVAAYCLRRLGSGRVIALEHSLHWAEAMRQDLRARELERFAEVRDAPLETHTIEGEPWSWFASRAQAFDRPIDLLVVDGPPAVGRRDARFPALPLLADRLSPEAFILCDDADRRGERGMLERWKRMYPGLEITTLPTKRGTARVRFRRAGS
jgi:hypothetical protein